MTSRTRLPTVWPTRPLSQPVITWLGVAPILKLNGVPRDQEESKTWPVRQMTPVYCATTVWPLVTAGPVPLIRVLVVRLFGGVTPLGIFTVGALPLAAVTVGRLPPPLETLDPDADAVSENFWIRSRTKTRVSEPDTPSWELPVDP